MIATLDGMCDDITIEVLGDALDSKDAGREGHPKRVMAFAVILARVIGLNPDRVRAVALGSLLHDIGKMLIPAEILLKPGKLQRSEQKVMREHCRLGYQILREIPFLKEAAKVAYCHQERYDGSGYPRGLKGNQIPLGARICSIVDTLDAITSDRAYRKAKSFAEARAEIMRGAHIQFDPTLVEAYLSVPDRAWMKLRQETIQLGTNFSPFSYAKWWKPLLQDQTMGRVKSWSCATIAVNSD